MTGAIAFAVLGLPVGSLINWLSCREPGFVYRDPADLPDDVDPIHLDDLEPPPAPAPVPWLAVARPHRVGRRWFVLTELVVAGTFGVTVHRLGWSLPTLVVLTFETALLALATVDFRVYRIPDRINFPSMAVCFAVLTAVSLVEGTPSAIAGAAIGGVLFAGLLFVAHVISPRGMGWGDVKLAWLMGFGLGWAGAETGDVVERVLGPLQWVLLAAVIGSVLGVIAGIAYAIVRRSAKAVFPYGPSLVAGCVIALVWGERFT